MPKTRIPMTISIIISFVDGVDDFGLGVIGGAGGVVLGDNSIDGVGNGVSVGAGVDVGASVGEGVMVGVLVGKKKSGGIFFIKKEVGFGVLVGKRRGNLRSQISAYT